MLGRRTFLSLLLCGLVLASDTRIARGDADTPVLRAGVAIRDLTPDRPVPLAGYAARADAVSTGVRDRVHVRAIHLTRGTQQISLVSLDLIGVDAALETEVRQELGWADDDAKRLVLTATHTHASLGGLSRAPLWRPMTGPFDASLRGTVVKATAECIRAAAAETVPVAVRQATREVPGLQRNRARSDGPRAPELGVVRLDRKNGQPLAVLMRYAAHATVLGAENLEISGDWPGEVCRRVGKAYDTHAQVFVGAMGDLAPRPPEGEGSPIDRFAAGLVAEVEQALQAAESTPGSDALTWTDGSTARPSVAAPLLGRGLELFDPVPIPLGTLTLGEHTFHFVPGEPVAAYEARLAPGPSRGVIACARDHLGYFTDRDAFRRGGYEASLSILGPDALDDAALPTFTPAEPRDGVAVLDHTVVPADTGWSQDYRFGLAHGVTLRAEIRTFLKQAEASLAKEALSRGAGLVLMGRATKLGVPVEALTLPLLVRAARRLHAHIPARFLDEMEGVARGAGVPYDLVLLQNTFLTLAEQTDPTKLLDLPVRCTNVVAMNEATSLGHVVHGSTLDWGMPELLRHTSRALVYVPPRGHPFLSVTWPGMVGTLRAMGAQGLSVTEESCSAGEDTRLEGLPVNLLLRQVVEDAACLEDAVRMAREAPGTCGYKLTFASGDELDARVVEVTATRSHVRRPQRGLLYGCAPDAPDACFVGPRDPAIAACDKSSAKRYPALAASLAGDRGRLRAGSIGAALGGREGGVFDTGTLLACVFEPQDRRAHIALGDHADVTQGALTFETLALPDLLPAHVAPQYAPPLPTALNRRAAPVKVTRTMKAGRDVERIVLEFPSPWPLGNAQADRVPAELFLPKDAMGVVIEIPAWKEATLAGHRFLAVGLARKGIATLILPLPGQATRVPDGMRAGQWTLSTNLARTRRLFTQALTEIARASAWLESEHGFAPGRQAISGVSLGGHAAALGFGALPERFRAGVFILAGANIHEVFSEPNPITGGLQRRLAAKGVTADEARPLLAWMEPSRFADPTRAADVLLIAAAADEVVAPKNAEALAKAWGGAPIKWLEGGHYAILGGLPRVIDDMAAHLTKAFQAK